MYSDLFKVGQIRLNELSVFNWGSFHGLHTAKIDIGGTLVTGDNGAGKTTFIDGLMALLLPVGRATFNVAAAQGDRSDRTLLSYMRGNFGSAHDGSKTKVKSKREQAVITGLRAYYLADDGSKITLAALFLASPSVTTSGEIKRHYVIANRDLQLKELLEHVKDGDIRTLKHWLKNDSSIAYSNDNFTDYQALYRKWLYMDNKNAPALLSRALGLKKIDDLTSLIRELVLEPSQIKEEARKVVSEFNDLVATHEQLTDARKQQQHLSKLPELKNTLNKINQTLTELTQDKNSLAAFFGELNYQYWEQKLQLLQQTLNELQQHIEQLNQQEFESQQQVDTYHADYINAGGDRIDILQQQLAQAKNELDRVTKQSSSYQQNVKELGLSELLTQSQFDNNQQQATEKLNTLEYDTKTAQDEFGEASATLSNLQVEYKHIQQQISVIENRPDSNIDMKFQQLRDEMIAALDLTLEQCRFIGELVDVNEQQRTWQGAIERALGGLKTTLIVPIDIFSLVTRWLNTRHTGLHVRVQVVPEIYKPDHNMIEFKPQGYLRKLIWREHPYRDWLKKYLSRFDLTCVDSTEQLDKTPFSITQAGLIHLEKGRFEKKDQSKIDDKRAWQLGFSNKSRLAILQHDSSELSRAIREHENYLSTKRQTLDLINQQSRLWQKLQDYCWQDIDVPHWQNLTTTLGQSLTTMLQNGSDLDKAKQLWDKAKNALVQLREQQKQLNRQEGSLKTQIDDVNKKIQQAKNDIALGIDEVVKIRLNQRIGYYTYNDLENIINKRNEYQSQLDDLITKHNKENNKIREIMIGTMSSFRQHWNIIANDWTVDILGAQDYLNYLNYLEREGLPQLVERFKERLTKHATQSLARIHQRLDSERDEILERIQIINDVLKRTEFRAGTYLKLNSKLEYYPHVVQFVKLLSKTLSLSTSDDHELRFTTLQEVVEILAKASNNNTANTLESLRLLEPRYQMSFFAEELDIETQEIIDVLESSSGKSGGEKESFAGTIVAASLAYALTPDGHDRPVYSTVFLDEAFSNTAEAVSRRVLRVFKALNIHVNLITPYKNLNLARESARSLLIAERNPQNHESRLCEVTWQEIDQQLSQAKKHSIMEQAKELGLNLDK